nr:hypothetical protein CFP56_36378 [Quercus suber]
MAAYKSMWCKKARGVMVGVLLRMLVALRADLKGCSQVTTRDQWRYRQFRSATYSVDGSRLNEWGQGMGQVDQACHKMNDWYIKEWNCCRVSNARRRSSKGDAFRGSTPSVHSLTVKSTTMRVALYVRPHGASRLTGRRFCAMRQDSVEFFACAIVFRESNKPRYKLKGEVRNKRLLLTAACARGGPFWSVQLQMGVRIGARAKGCLCRAGYLKPFLFISP